MDFLRPMHIGDVAHVTAQVIGATAHSIEVNVVVRAESGRTGETTQTNEARAWYVAVAYETPPQRAGRAVAPLKPLPVPPFPHPTAAAAAEADERIRLQREDRQAEGGHEMPLPAGDATLAHALNPAECSLAGLAQAGVVMKLMDHAAGIAAVRHTRRPCVTASLESVNFVRPVANGEIVSLYAKPVFASRKSMEIAVDVYAENPLSGSKVLTNTSRFTFVALGADLRAVEVPAVEPASETELRLYAAAKERYERRKATRAAAGGQ